jgi:hypothetical protein
MVEALAASSLVSNVVQFVDVRGRLVSGATEIYCSASGALKENEELDRVTVDL